MTAAAPAIYTSNAGSHLSGSADNNSTVFSQPKSRGLGGKIFEYLSENPVEDAKFIKAPITMAAQFLANSGNLEGAATARAVAAPFAKFSGAAGLIGGPLCFFGAMVSYANVGLELAKQAKKESPAERSYLGAWKEFLDGSKKLFDAGYCVKDVTDLLVPADKMSLVASKITGLVSLFGGLLGSVFALAKDGVSFALLHKDNREGTIIARYGENSAAPKPDVMSRYREMKLNAGREIIFSVVKNIFNLTMSVIAALAILGGIAMAPSASVIVFSVLTIGAVVFKVVSHINKEQKKEAELAACLAELRVSSPPSPQVALTVSPEVGGNDSSTASAPGLAVRPSEMSRGASPDAAGGPTTEGVELTGIQTGRARSDLAAAGSSRSDGV